MHHIYHTNSLVLSSKNISEASKQLVLFTREHGLIYAKAQGIRLIKSKLRFALQDYSYSKIDIVYGKTSSIITSAVNIDTFNDVYSDRYKLNLVAKIFLVIERYCGEDGLQSDIFDDLIDFLNLIKNNLSIDKLNAIEMHLMLRILYFLGYINLGEKLNIFIKNKLSNENFDLVIENKKIILSSINNALSQSQL